MKIKRLLELKGENARSNVRGVDSPVDVRWRVFMDLRDIPPESITRLYELFRTVWPPSD